MLLYTNLFLIHCETNIFSLRESSLNPFLESTSTKLWG